MELTFKEKLFMLQPFRFYCLSVLEYFEHEAKITELLRTRGLQIFPDFKMKYLFEAEPCYNTTRQDKNRKLIDFTSNDHIDWYVCIIYTNTSCTYWLSKSKIKPDFESAFQDILNTIYMYDCDDLIELLPRLRDDYGVDLNSLDFSYEDWMLEKMGDVRVSLLECFCDAGFKSNHSYHDTWQSNMSQEELFRHLS